MKLTARLLLLTLALALLPVAGSRAEDAAAFAPEAWYRALVDARPALATEVHNLTLSRDVATFTFKSGWIEVFAPAGGRHHAAVFRGEGVFSLTPPDALEKAQLKKFTEKEALAEPFDAAVFRFTDDTVKEIEAALRLEPPPAGMGGESRKLYEETRKDFLEQQLDNLDSRVLMDIASGTGGLFLADIRSKSLGRFSFEIEPLDREEVTLYRREKVFDGMTDVWCSFHRKEQYEGGRVKTDPKTDLVQVPHFETDLAFEKKGDLKATATLDLRAEADSVRAVTFQISSLIDIDAIKDEAGDPCYFVHEKARDRVGEPALKQRELVVYLPTAIPRGETRKLTFIYHSDKLVDRLPETKVYIIKDTTGWFPTCGYLQRATSRSTYRVPPDIQLVAVGRKEKEWDEGGLKCSTWVQEIPVAFICFNIGDFKKEQVKVEGLPTADVYMSKEHTGIRFGGSEGQNVAADMMNSIQFFQQIFGPYPFPNIVATEIPASHGQGFPGFLHLGSFTFEDGLFQEYDPPQGFDEFFRAHEVSHQWWGHVVGWDTYRDQWLSEGFAEYSGAMFAAQTLQGKKSDLLLRMVESWSDDILHKGNMSFERYGMGKVPSRLTQGNEAGPLWLGARLSCSKGPIDYQILVYEKGAYVLHMLRMMMRDLNTGKDDKFLAMMKEFVSRYTGKEATTEGFRRIAEKHMNMDLGWFFDQWVYGTAVPRYKFTHRVEPGPDGKDLLVCDVEQSGVPEGFKMPVLLKLDFGEDRVSLLRVPVTKAAETFKLRLPARPKKVEFNFYKSVLCYLD